MTGARLAAAAPLSSRTTRAASASIARGPASRPPTEPANAPAPANAPSSGQQLTSHQDERHQRAGSQRPGAGQRHDEHREQHQQRRPPPHRANGHRPGTTSGDDLARIRRIIAALLRKPAAPPKGKSPREVRRCLTRAVARGLYRLLERQAAPSPADRSTGLAVASNRKASPARSTLAGGN
ncbi:MAG TPA: hypothetical protein VHS79_23940 [Actinomycetes bacterium]|nr:hypothetical protein [Actinomycetes bacterium]